MISGGSTPIFKHSTKATYPVFICKNTYHHNSGIKTWSVSSKRKFHDMTVNVNIKRWPLQKPSSLQKLRYAYSINISLFLFNIFILSYKIPIWPSVQQIAERKKYVCEFCYIHCRKKHGYILAHDTEEEIINKVFNINKLVKSSEIPSKFHFMCKLRQERIQNL